MPNLSDYPRPHVIELPKQGRDLPRIAGTYSPPTASGVRSGHERCSSRQGGKLRPSLLWVTRPIKGICG